MQEIRENIRKVILWISFVVVALILLRFILLVFNADPSHPLSSVILDLTTPLVAPFSGIFIGSGLELFIAEAIAIFAIVFWILAAVLISEIITTFIDDKPVRITANFLDVLVKFLEFLLLARVILKLTGVTAGQSSFVESIYQLTAWAEGLLPSWDLLWGELELSTLLVLAILGVVDFFIESVVTALASSEAEEGEKPKPKPVAPVANKQPQPAQQAPTQRSPQASGQNITINVGQQPTQPQQSYPQYPQPAQNVSSVPKQKRKFLPGRGEK